MQKLSPEQCRAVAATLPEKIPELSNRELLVARILKTLEKRGTMTSAQIQDCYEIFPSGKKYSINYIHQVMSEIRKAGLIESGQFGYRLVAKK